MVESYRRRISAMRSCAESVGVVDVCSVKTAPPGGSSVRSPERYPLAFDTAEFGYPDSSDGYRHDTRATHDAGDRDEPSGDRVAAGVDRTPPSAARRGEGGHRAARPAEHRAARAADGGGHQALPVRGPLRVGVAARP